MLGNQRGLSGLRTSYICFTHCYNICHIKTNFTYENLQTSYTIPPCQYSKQNSVFKRRQANSLFGSAPLSDCAHMRMGMRDERGQENQERVLCLHLSRYAEYQKSILNETQKLSYSKTWVLIIQQVKWMQCIFEATSTPFSDETRRPQRKCSKPGVRWLFIRQCWGYY